MRVIHFVLIAWTALSGAALAQGAGNAAGTGSEKTDVAPIHFNLATPKPPRPESLPTATTLGELTYATEDKPEAKPAPKVVTKAAPKPAPKAAPKPARKVAVAAKPAKGPWMSEWRRAYIAKHGHQPPVPPR